MSQEEDDEKKALKERILGYSVSVKNFAKWFAITDVKRIDESYTAYKVVYRVKYSTFSVTKVPLINKLISSSCQKT